MALQTGEIVAAISAGIRNAKYRQISENFIDIFTVAVNAYNERRKPMKVRVYQEHKAKKKWNLHFLVLNSVEIVLLLLLSTTKGVKYLEGTFFASIQTALSSYTLV